MYTVDEIKRIMEPTEETPEIGFIEDMKPDRQAAAMRYYLVEDILYDWHGKLNDRRMNTREIPKELKELQLLIFISIFGLFLFLLIWETRSRYLVNYIPLFLINAYMGICAINNEKKLKDGRIKK